MFTSIHHVALSVNNLQESIDWYEEKLGFTLLKRYQNKEMSIALISLNNISLELFHLPNSKELPKYSQDIMRDLQVVGTKHFCIETDNLATSMKEFEEKGIQFVDKPDTTFFGGTYVFFKDCNGILIELYQS